MRVIALVVGLCSVAAALPAQTSSYTMAGRHQITLSVGLNSSAGSAVEVGAAGVTVTNNATGVLGGIGYAFWPEDHLAVGVAVTAMAVNADVSVSGSGTFVQDGAVGSLQLGIRYRFARLTASNVVRPYLAVSVGPLISSAETIRAGFPPTVSIVEQTVASGQATVGVELALGRSFTLGVDAGYFLAAEFDQRVGARDDYSSPVIALSLGVVLGRGRAAAER